MMTIEHEAFKAAGTNTDDADDRTVLLAILGCAQSWSGEVRILGNVRASDAFRAVRNAIAQLSTADDLLKSLKAAVDIIDEHVGPCPDCERMRAYLVRLHVEGVLSEGQAAKATGLYRVDLRKAADDLINSGAVRDTRGQP